MIETERLLLRPVTEKDTEDVLFQGRDGLFPSTKDRNARKFLFTKERWVVF